jgi:transcriptional regulator with XRE-family HTH domain
VDAPSSGHEVVDELLDGLRIGDNVVIQTDDVDASFLVRGFVGAAAGSRPLVYVAATREPGSIRRDLEDVWDDDRFVLLSWDRLGGPEPEDLLDAAREKLTALDERLGPGAVYVIDSLTGIQERWGTDAALEFFLWACPRLYHRGPVALWMLDRGRHSPHFLARLRDITQVVVEVRRAGDGVELEVAKADGRGESIVGRRVRFALTDGEISAPTWSSSPRERVGELIRAERLARGLSQADLARSVGISPSALSQVERGVRGLSGESLTRVWEQLGVPFGPTTASTPGYEVHARGAQRPRELARGATGRLVLEDGHRAVWMVELAAGSSSSLPLFAVKAPETAIVLAGVVALQVAGTTETLHEGDSIRLMTASAIGWSNPGPRPAQVLWTIES